MKLGLHNLPFIYATLVQFIMIKQLAYIKKNNRPDWEETKKLTVKKMKKRPISIAKGTINIKNLLDLLHAFEDLEKAIKQFK